MSGTRLLIIADAKMLPALAGGLREGEKFEVLTASFSDPVAVQAAAEQADAIALFYGAPGAPLPAALHALAPKVRDRGGRVVAVLQREQAAQRDECFRAGASDLLFMPMPKDQFVARLSGSVGLSWATEAGATSPVSVATRSAASQVEQATVSSSGVEATAELPVKAGDTVRLAWGTFHHWGLVVRSGGPLQIRFAGLAPDEEAQIRDWLQSGAKAAPKSAPAAAASAPEAAADVPQAAAPQAVAAAAPPEAAAEPQAAAPEAPAAKAAETPPAGTPKPPAAAEGAPRVAPAGGPPPGFADRKPIRPQVRTPPRVPPPVMAAAGATAAVTPPAGNAAAPAPANGPDPSAAPAPAPAVAAVVAAPGAALSGIFEEAAAPAAAPVPGSPPWPIPASLDACKAAALQLLKDKTVPTEAPPALAAAARKITGMLGSAERAALEKDGPEAQFATALAARIMLDAATSEGVKLYSSRPAAAVDSVAVASMTKLVDEAAARLQKEANAAIGKGQVESLQLLTAASAALSRDLLAFKETTDRLRGIGAAPRLGAGALDPDMVLPGQQPRPKAAPSGAPAPVKAELRDFRGLDRGPGRSKRVVAALVIAGAVIAGVNGFYFGIPRRSEMAIAGAGDGVTRIEVTGDVAMVTVTPDWVTNAVVRAGPLANALRPRRVKKALLLLPSGKTTGALDVATGKVVGIPKKAN